MASTSTARRRSRSTAAGPCARARARFPELPFRATSSSRVTFAVRSIPFPMEDSTWTSPLRTCWVSAMLASMGAFCRSRSSCSLATISAARSASRLWSTLVVVERSPDDVPRALMAAFDRDVDHRVAVAGFDLSNAADPGATQLHPGARVDLAEGACLDRHVQWAIPRQWDRLEGQHGEGDGGHRCCQSDQPRRDRV